MRTKVALSCSQCKARNYRTTRVQRDGVKPLMLKKFCKACNSHTMHIETK
jgi:large subunit ribosomal protein L33